LKCMKLKNANRNRVTLTHTLVLALLLLAAPCLAEDMSAGDYLMAGARSATWAHGYLSTNLEELARALDSILGGQRAMEDTTGSYLRIRGGASQIAENDPELSVDTKLQLILPNTNDKLKIEFDSGRYLDKMTAADRTADQLPVEESTGAADSSSLFAGLILNALRSENWRISLGGGVKVDWPLDPNVRAQIAWTSGGDSDWRLNLGEEGFWYSTEGFSARTRAEVTGKITRDSLLSLSAIALWTDGNNDWQLGQTLALLTAVDEDTGLAYRVGALQKTRPRLSEDRYFTDITCRRRLYSDWLFMEMRASVSWPRDRDFTVTPGVFLWLETLFKG